MSNPLVEKRPGDLGALGLPAKKDLESFDEIAVREEQEMAVEPEGVQEPEPQPEEVVEEVQESQESDESSLLSDYLESQQPSEESELTRLRQEKARLEGLVEGRIGAIERALQSPATEPPPEPEGRSVLQSPVVRATLDALRDEDPAKYEAALVELATKQAEDRIQSRLDELSSKVEKREKEGQIDQQQAALWQQVESTFDGIKAKGGVQVQLIQDLEQNLGGSLLGKKFLANPAALLSPQGIRGTVDELEAELRAHAAQRSAQPGQATEAVGASTVGGSASKRSLALDEQPEKKSYAEEVRESIKSAGKPTDKLSFMR